jgi:hypothetical protein
MASASPAARLVRLFAPSAVTPATPLLRDADAFDRAARYLMHVRSRLSRGAAVSRIDGLRDAEQFLRNRAAELRGPA